MNTYQGVLAGLAALGLSACSSTGAGSGDVDSGAGMSSGSSMSSGSTASGASTVNIAGAAGGARIPSGSNPSSDNGADDGDGAGGSLNATDIGEPVGWGQSGKVADAGASGR